MIPVIVVLLILVALTAFFLGAWGIALSLVSLALSLYALKLCRQMGVIYRQAHIMGALQKRQQVIQLVAEVDGIAESEITDDTVIKDFCQVAPRACLISGAPVHLERGSTVGYLMTQVLSEG